MRIKIRKARKRLGLFLWLPNAFITSKLVCNAIKKNANLEVENDKLCYFLRECKKELKPHKNLKLIEIQSADGEHITITV